MATSTEERNQKERTRYAAHRERECLRKRTEALARKSRQGEEADPFLKYLGDYAQEFRELTAMGMSCREITERCDPGQAWFRRNVFPLVDRALCNTCKMPFNPNDVDRGTECSATCQNAYTGFGTWGKSRWDA